MTLSVRSSNEAEYRAVATRDWVIAFLVITYATVAANGPSGLLYQPVLRYAKEQLGLNATAISLYMSLIGVPWLIKPLFGLISDAVPIYKSRRKPYLAIAAVLAVGALFALAAVPAPLFLMVELMIVATSMAVISSVCGALLVENGQRLKAANIFANYQWLALNLTLIAAGLAGGYLAEWLSPLDAVRTAAAILFVGTSLTMIVSVFLAPETRLEGRFTAKGVASKISSGVMRNRLPILALFLFLFMFRPGIGLPMYFHMTNDLEFSQKFIGTLNSIGSVGAVCGALAYHFVLGRLQTRTMLQITIVLDIVSTLGYLLLSGPLTAVALNFQGGFVGVITAVTVVSLVADFCPAGVEGFTFAILATVENLAIRAADITGGYIYDYVVNHQIAPLIVVSALATLLCAPLLPFLDLYDKRQGVAYEPGPVRSE